MKKIIITLVVVLLSSIVIAKTTHSVIDIFIKEDVMEPYRKSIEKANTDYEKYCRKYADPIFVRAKKVRVRNIEQSSNAAIDKLTRAGAKASPLEKKKLTIQIAALEKLRDADIGDVPKVAPKTSVISACGVKYKEHTYLAIALRINWKEAKAICEKMGGHLVYLETAEEMLAMKHYFGTIRFLTGGIRVKKGDWRWGNGKIVNRKLWRPDYPQHNNDYIAYIGDLVDLPKNNESIGFICEWE